MSSGEPTPVHTDPSALATPGGGRLRAALASLPVAAAAAGLIVLPPLIVYATILR